MLLKSLSRIANFVADVTIIEESVGEVLALHMVPHITLGSMAKLSTDLAVVTKL